MKFKSFTKLLVITALLLFTNCITDGNSVSNDFSPEDYRLRERPASGITEFSSDFDSELKLVDLFPEDYSGWTYLQLVEPNGSEDIVLEDKKAFAGENSIELQSDRFRSGSCAVRLAAPPSGNSVSKASLQKDGLFFESGDDLWVSVWFFIQGFENCQALFILDMETTEFQGSPGRRLMMSGGDNELKLESKGGVSGPEYRQNRDSIMLFPRNKWVHIVLHMRLSGGWEGLTEVWQDGTRIIMQSGQNLPTDGAVYDRFQFGITANSSSHDKVIYIDDVVISKKPLLNLQ